MKIECACGNLIADTTDFIACKAWFVADQDREDGTGERTMYECDDCGRLLVQKRGSQEYASFTPDESSKGILRSNAGSRWRGFLRGHWGAGALSSRGGSIWWTCGDGESGIEEFDDVARLEARYRELFTSLRRRDVLRDAFLRKDGETVHTWP